MSRVKVLLVLVTVFAALLFAQGGGTGTLRGTIQDETGAVIPGAEVTATGPRGDVHTSKAGEDGTYSFTGLAPGQYSVKAASPGLEQFQPANVAVGASTQTVNIQLRVAAETQQITVQETAAPTVSVDPSNNVGAIVLTQQDLESLSDDPDDLQADLQALAGPGAGPNGGQIYIDGFTNGNFPPKESIREVRINSNPFSAEYDKIGFGRIEIFTKPGTDKLRGTAFFDTSNGALNARNPYLLSESSPSFMTKEYGANLSGPLSKKASFFIDVERRGINDGGVINSQIVTCGPQGTLCLGPASNPQIVTYSAFVPTPQQRTTFSPRVDYQLTSNDTLTVRYSFMRSDISDYSVGQFNLQSLGYNTLSGAQTAQITNNIVLGPTMIHETRFQYQNTVSQYFGNNTIPEINVASAFATGGPQVGNYSDKENHYELQDFTSINKGKHALKFGLRVRGFQVNNYSPRNFGGTFTFVGNELTGVLSSQIYAQTLAYMAANPGAGIFGGTPLPSGLGPAQFTFSYGQPFAYVGQADVEPYIQDDWRVFPNLTVSMGLRYEWQNNLNDTRDWAPRVAVAWAPGSKNNLRPKTVLRAGWGIFYDRFQTLYAINALRYGYENPLQEQYILPTPGFFQATPLSQGQLQQLIAQATPTSSLYQLSPALRAPYLLQTALSVERQLPWNTAFSVNYTNTRGVHEFLTDDVNAPLPGTYTYNAQGQVINGVRPFPQFSNIYQYQSNGLFKQTQITVQGNTRIGNKVQLFFGYAWNDAHSNTDGIGSFPANPYSLSEDWGRSSLDTANRVWMGGNVLTVWGVRLSPMLQYHSGTPYNIYLGQDIYGDAVLSNARPAFAPAGSACGGYVVCTAVGKFDINPVVAAANPIPRNYGTGPDFFTLNLRLSRTFGFGGERAGGANRNRRQGGGGPGGPPGGGFGGGGFPGGGGRGGGGGFPGGGGRGGFGGGGESTSQRYNVTISVQARNALNTNNPGAPTGLLQSPYFGISNSLAGGYAAETNSADNRRIDFQVRFQF